MRRVLVTCVGGDVGNAVVRSLAGENEISLFGCDINEYVPDLHLMQYHIVPRYDNDKYWPYLQNLLLSLEITHFIPIAEPELIFLDKHRDFFLQNNIALIMNSSSIIQTFTSKYRTAKFLSLHDICGPKTYQPMEIPSNILYPLIVKPDSGRGSENVSLVQNKAELYAALENTSCPVIQEYIGSPEDEYTIGVFADGSTVHSICFKRSLGLGGMSVQVCTNTSHRARQIAEDVAKSMHLCGAINIQLRKQNEEFYIFEINPRLSSTVGFRYKLGFKDVLWWMDVLDGKSVPQHFQAPDNVVGVKCLTEQIIYLNVKNPSK